MFLQVLPPDFKFVGNQIIGSNSKLIFLALLAIIIAIFSAYLIIKRKPLSAEILSACSFIKAVIIKDFRKIF
jgi:hypothetical protein